MKIKVFSFNIRIDNPQDGINYQPNRFARIKELISSEAPDIIGFQETGAMARKWLSENLDAYTVLGTGRLKGFAGEGLTLAYKRDKFELFTLDTFWLSNQPTVPESTYGGDQSTCPRIAQVAVLVPRDENAEPFVFCNVHLDHKGKDARKIGAMQVMQKLLAMPYRFIMTGDFNATPDDGSIALIRDCTVRKIADITAGLGGTFHNWGMKEVPAKIDYIFTDFESFDNVRIIDDEHPGGVYYTDHYVVSGEIDI